MVNYTIAPENIEHLVPRGTTLDFWNGETYLSLVAFKFRDTRVLGIPIPFHRNFLEVNLRFYVKRETENEIRRGVCFIKEIVPRAAITLVARTVYGEPYETWKMSHKQSDNEISYSWSKRRLENHLAISFGDNLGIPKADSHETFITEHYWGYTKRDEFITDEYKVEHPQWNLFEVNDAEIDVDFGATYGDEFAFLNESKPKSVLLAQGSEIVVYKGARISV